MNKKGLIGIAKMSFLLVLLMLSIFLIYQTISFAEGSAAIWTTDVYGNSKTDFAPYTKVYIHGSDFLENHKIDVSVTRPDNVEEKGFTFSDSIGSFVYEYQLDGIEGLYNVLATDKTYTAQIAFNDSINVNLDQWANEDVQWQNGNLNPSNSKYYEGEAVPFRLIITGLPGGSHYIHINYDFTSGGIYAYDFLTRFDLSEHPGISADTSVPLPPGPINNYTIPSDTFDNVATHELPASQRYISIKGGSVTSIAAITHSGPVSGNSEADMIVTFNTGSCTVDCTIFMLWGGHLASELDWGDGMGASSISGSPFHMRTQSLDGGGQKNQDRSIQPGAVLPPPTCDSYTNQSSCDIDPNCDWCPLCEYPVSQTKTNQWFQARCVPAGTNCGWHCEVGWCGATCSLDTQCECPTDGCMGDDYYNYPGYGSCVDCPTSCYCDIGTNTSQPCEPNITHCTGDGCYPYETGCEDRNYFCTVGGCNYTYSNRNTDYYDSYEHYCLYNEVRKHREFHDFYCNGICSDHTSWSDDQLIKDCDSLDKWYDTGNTKWVDTDQCNEKEQKEQEYRDYYCSDTPSVDCYYDVTNTQWVDTGNTRYKDFSTYCDNGLYCDGEDHCDGAGSCVGLGQPVDCSHLDDDCQEGVCDEDADECIVDYSNYPWSTPCELDDDLCTNDHCNGAGSCVFKNNTYVPPAEECKSFYCDPSDGQVKENYFDYSTTCDNELYCDGEDHCDGYGSCVNLGPLVDCSYLDSDCQQGVCNEGTDQCEPDYYDYSTFCELDDNLCTLDHCNGLGSCEKYDDVDCSRLDDECQEGLCNPTDGQCYPDYYDYSTPCDNGLYCDGEDHCDGVGQCVGLGQPIDCSYLDDECNVGICDEIFDECVIDPLPESTPCDNDLYCDGPDHCDGLGVCVSLGDDVDCSRLDDECNVGFCSEDNDRCEYDPFTTSTPCDNDLYCDGPDHCDATNAGGLNPAVCVNLGQPVDCSHLDDDCQEGVCDEDADECIVDYSNYPWSTPCELDQNQCTIDHCDGTGSCINYYNVSIPSIPNKTVGDPKVECKEEDWCDYKITMITPITLSCEDGANVSWRYALDGQWKEWNTDASSVTIYFPEECNHTLEVKCVGICDESSVDSENFKVEGTKFEIPLYFKWNLISVPFTLLSDEPKEVFKNTGGVESVWAFDSVNNDWLVWTPGDAPDTLDSIEPGWGYWVLEIEDEEWLVVGGALFDEGPILPSGRNLTKGWNLIGYYGTSWELYNWSDFNFVCGDVFNYPDKYIYGDKLYCALNSLINTQEGYPKWSSLWSYINCGNHEAYWLGLNTCADPENPIQTVLSRMYAGRGYWIELDETDFYSPASTCIWKNDFECRWTGGGIIP